jgi:hypothetical protein
VTRRDFIYKWLIYGLALLPVWWLDTYILNRVPLLGVSPVLLPLAAVAVAVQEGAVAGAGFGLAVGLLCSAVYAGSSGGIVLGVCLIGWGAGAAAQYVLSQNFGGCLLCSMCGLAGLDAARILTRLLNGAGDFSAMLRLAGLEILWSMAFVFFIYSWFRRVRRQIAKFLRL